MLSMIGGGGPRTEEPIILFDSHPTPPAGIILDSLSRIKKQLYIAWTGDVVLDVEPGWVRLQWYTTDGNFGKRDYELRAAQDAREGFEKLRDLEDVARCMVVGYPSQNPFGYGPGSGLLQESEWARGERKKRELLGSEQYKDFVPRDKKEAGIGDRIEGILAEDDLRERLERKKVVQRGDEVGHEV